MPNANGGRVPARPLIPGGPRRPAAGSGREQPRTPRKPRNRHRLSRALRVTVGVLLLAFVYTIVTLPPYLTAPGSAAIHTRVTQWGRDHHASWLVSWLESET
jgi:hypothetical protein